MIEDKRLTRFVSNGNQYNISYLQRWNDNFARLVGSHTRLPGASGSVNNNGINGAPVESGSVQGEFILSANLKPEMTAKEDAVRAISRWEQGRLYMQPADPLAGERFCVASVETFEMGDNYNKHSGLIKPVTFAFKVTDPHWYQQGTFPWSWGDGTAWGGNPWGGTAPINAVSGLQTDFTITRPLNSAPVRPRIKIRCATGETAQDVTVQRITVRGIEDEVKLIGTLVANDVLDINAFAYNVKKNGVNAYTSLFTYKYADWFLLMPGANTIRVKFNNVSDDASVTVEYLEAYV